MPDPLDERPLRRPLILHDVHARRAGTEVLSGVSLEFPAGSRTTIIGPSGAGKSTLLRLLNRLADPSSGRIILGETPISAYPVTTLRRTIGLVLQAPRPLPGLVADNLAYPRRVGSAHRLRPPGRWAEPTLRDSPDAEALAEVGLDPSWLGRDAAGLSGGERQRLALAVALGVGPAILGLDEPTSALDPSSARRVADALRLRSDRDGLTTIAVTHNRDHAAWLGDVTVVLDSGRVVDLGPSAEVLARDDASFWAEEAAR